MSETASPTGLFGSLRRLGESALSIVQVRLELFGTELEQEKLRLFDALLWAAVGMMMVGLTLVLLLGFVVMLFWEGYRLPAVGVLVLLFAACSVWLLSRAREGLKARDGGAFALTLRELRRDRAALDAAEPAADSASPPGPAGPTRP